MCIFGREVAGHFNLYRGGEKTRPNDGIKIRNLRAVIEVKGSNGTERLSDKGFAKQILMDIKKLTTWRSRFVESGYQSTSSGGPEPRFVMLAIDSRTKPMPKVEIDKLHQTARTEGIQLHYLHQ